MLAVLWVVGGTLWLMGVSHNRVWCFAVTLLTVVCVGCEGVWGVGYVKEKGNVGRVHVLWELHGGECSYVWS